MTIHKNWCFTLNNYTDEDILAIEGWTELGVKGAAYGREIGKNGTPHLQGFLVMTGKVGLTKMKELHPRAHWEVMNGRLDQNEAYCSKQSELTVVGKEDGSVSVFIYNSFLS